MLDILEGWSLLGLLIGFSMAYILGDLQIGKGCMIENKHIVSVTVPDEESFSPKYFKHSHIFETERLKSL